MPDEEQASAVELPAEHTAEPESAPELDQAPEPQTPPAGESSEPERKVTDSVPYERFKEVNDRLKQLEAMVPQQLPPAPVVTQPVVPSANYFEPETEQTLNQWYAAQRERDKVSEFTKRHAEELKDPLLSGAVTRLIQEGNAAGQYVDAEAALAQAKDLLEKRINPEVKKAESQGFEEGRNVAHLKAHAGAVGDISIKAPVKSEDEMTAAEYAASMGLTRTQ